MLPQGVVQLTCEPLQVNLDGEPIHGHDFYFQTLPQQILDQGGDIEVLRSPESRQALAKYGQIGALLRYAYTTSPSFDEGRKTEDE
jgi:hypothetical protein